MSFLAYIHVPIHFPPHKSVAEIKKVEVGRTKQERKSWLEFSLRSI